jgi:hypothetical protein
MTTILLTGLPRSGTNLVCTCLNTLPNCVALTEPMQVPRHGDADRAVDEIIRYADAARDRLRSEGLAYARTVNGVIADNFYREAVDDNGLRSEQTDAGVTLVKIGKPLAPDFRLFIKHPGIFTVLAKPLLQKLPLYAIVRHPIGVLASWQTVDTALRQGRWPVVEAFAPDLKERLDSLGEPLDRQIAIMKWAFQVYHDLPRERVLTYETIVRDPVAALRPLSASTKPITHLMHSVNPHVRYAGVDFAALAGALTIIAADVEPFFPDFTASLRSGSAGSEW